MNTFNGLGMNLGTLSRLSAAQTRSLSPENFTGEKGRGGMAGEGTGAACARDLGVGWKISPSVRIRAGEIFTVADVQGPGAIQHIWMTPTGNWRFAILRIYWDGQEQPSVEVPLGDFFCCGWGTDDGRNHMRENFRQLSSLAVCVNPGSAFNCYWEMPFRERCVITVENLQPEDAAKPDAGAMVLYYQVDYTLTEVPQECAYFHAQWRRSNPLPYQTVHTLLDGVHGQGHYVGTYLAWGVNNNGWWGEGEIKFFLDGDQEVPDHLRHGHRGLFLRLLQLRCGQGAGRLSRVLHALCRACTSSAPGRAVPGADALQSLPVAHHGSGSLYAGSDGHHPGPWLAQRRALSALAGRHRFDGFLVSDAADGALSCLAVTGWAGSDLKFRDIVSELGR